MAFGIDPLEPGVQQANAWLDDVAALIDAPDRQLGYQALRAVLTALRDRVGVDHAAAIAAHLPLLIRGVFYEGFRPAAARGRAPDRASFLASVDAGVFRSLEVTPEAAVRAVMKVLAQRADPDDAARLQGLMPAEVRDLWPAPAPLRASPAATRPAPPPAARRPTARTRSGRSHANRG